MFTQPKEITEDTAIGYDDEGFTIKAERLSKWTYRQLESAPDMYKALEESAELIKIARQYFPKSIKNYDRFTLENVCACINKALSKARGEL